MPDETLRCPECLVEIHPDWQHCTHCGSRLQPRETIIPMAPAPAPPGVPVCGNCRAAVDTTGSFCWKCGVPLETGRQPFIPAQSGSVPEEEPPEAAGPLAYPRWTRPGTSSPPRVRRARGSARPPIGAILFLVGIAILLVSLFVGWYTITSSSTDTVPGISITVNGTASFYPLNHVTESFSCTGSSNCAITNGSYSGTYSQSGVSNLGTLYDAVAGLVIAGIGLGVVSVFLAFVSGGKPSRLTTGLALLAVLLVALAPTVLFADQPSALSSQGPGQSGPSPRTSFFGSCSGSGCGTALTSGETLNSSWGPALGWYLCLAAVAPFLAGLFAVRKGKRAYRGPITQDMLT